MRALWVDGSGLHLGDAPVAVPDTEQALIRIQLAGICNTDLEICRGYKGFSGILGHEFVGIVTAGAPAWAGRRVVGDINVACGRCAMCQRQVPSQCEARRTVGMIDHPGAFAEYLALAARNLHAVPDEVRDEQAVFTEPLAAALQIIESVPLSPRDRVVLIGAGKLGLLAAQVLKLHGVDLRVIVRRDEQEILLARWGITAIRPDGIEQRSADVVVDCTGTADGFAAALDWVRPHGTIVLKSTYVGSPTVDMTRIVVDEVRVIGSRCGPFEPALRLLAHGLIDTDSLIEREFALEQGIDAFEQARQPGALKVLLRP